MLNNNAQHLKITFYKIYKSIFLFIKCLLSVIICTETLIVAIKQQNMGGKMNIII